MAKKPTLNSLPSFNNLIEADKKRKGVKTLIEDLIWIQQNREIEETRKIAKDANRATRTGKKIILVKKLELAYASDGRKNYANDKEKGRSKPTPTKDKIEQLSLKREVTEFDVINYKKTCRPGLIVAYYTGLNGFLEVRVEDLYRYVGITVRFIR